MQFLLCVSTFVLSKIENALNFYVEVCRALAESEKFIRQREVDLQNPLKKGVKMGRLTNQDGGKKLLGLRRLIVR
jgi:hypothetical protein